MLPAVSRRPGTTNDLPTDSAEEPRIKTKILNQLIRLIWHTRLILISLLLLAIPATIYHSAFLKNGERSWWFYSTNDACQGFSAHSLSQRLGGSVETAVWPGATLATPYLYRSMFLVTPPLLNGQIDVVEKLLEDSVYFHWNMASIYGVAFIWLFYIFLYRLTESNFISLFASCILVINPSFAMQVTSVRPELPSLLWFFAAALLATNRMNNQRSLGEPIFFGVFVGLAVFSKIQVLPALPFVVAIYFWKRWPSAERCSSGGNERLTNLGIAAIVFAASFGFLKPDFFQVAGYSLADYPPSAGTMAFVSVTTFLIVAMFLTFSEKRPIRFLAEGSIRMLGGGIIALGIITLPNLIFGGFRVFLTSVNTILFGTVSYSRYGLGLDSGLGWGLAKTFQDKIESFINFQSSSSVPFVGSHNLMLIVFFILVGVVFLTNILCLRRFIPGTTEQSNRYLHNNWTVVFFLIAILLDYSMTARTARGTVYSFYHIYSIPFYLLAVATASRSLLISKRDSDNRNLDFSRLLLGYLLAIFVLVYCPSTSDAVKSWGQAEQPPDKYLTNIAVIDSVSPSFFRRTQTTLDDLKMHVSQSVSKRKRQ